MIRQDAARRALIRRRNKWATVLYVWTDLSMAYVIGPQHVVLFRGALDDPELDQWLPGCTVFYRCRTRMGKKRLRPRSECKTVSAGEILLLLADFQ